MEETITSKDKKQFGIELILALILTGLACAAGFSNILFASNDLYPAATDFLGHMAKLRYITHCIQDGILPSWFPYWYCGAAVTQYYPPLSYYLMVPIYAITNNVMLTFKIGCLSAIYIGGIGVWFLSRKFIGRWCGLFGSVVFCLQPYVLLTLLDQGQVAQGPIIALTPWYLIGLLSFCRKPTARRFLICTVICLLMILSHPNSIFMYSLCIMGVLTVFLLIRKIEFLTYLYISLSIIFAGILTAFWSVVGVTGLENPTIPVLLGEAVTAFTATIDWFVNPKNFFYFSLSTSIGSVLAILLYTYRRSKKLAGKGEKINVLFAAMLTVISAFFSFGLQIPFFEYLPMAESFVAGRILNLTGVTAAILCSYLLYGIHALGYGKKVQIRIFASFVCLVIVISVLFDMNPFRTEYRVRSDEDYRNLFSVIDSSGTNFEKGRYTFLGPFDCSQNYYPLEYDFNMSEGYNIEGTTQNQAIWSAVVANSSGTYDYIAKNLAFWNVRYIFIFPSYDNVSTELNKRYDFRMADSKSGSRFYVSEDPSSYFLTDNRNALLFGAGSPGLAMEFPYLIHDQRDAIFDYSIEELQKYRLIYLCEPEVNTLAEKESIEAMVTELIGRGVTIVIEPTNTKGYQLFDVAVSEVFLEESPTIQKQNGSKIISEADDIIVDESMKYGRAMFGLDKVYYKLIQNGGRLENDIIGVKKVGNGEVIFIGKHLSQYLKAVYVRNWGVPEREPGFPECSDEVKALFTDIFKTYGVNTNFWPEPFPVTRADWNYKGVNFQYSSHEAQEMTLSVTYTPRWKATLDGKTIEVGQKENLIALDLPAGDHEVKLVYGLTIYGIIGYIISLVGLFFFVLFIKYYGIITYRFRLISKKINKFLQLTDTDYTPKDLHTGDMDAEKL
ncbi:MAG: 6-pyruvoyl-tetrahydropterin synthase-related protein [Eubacteriales bacterium]|nr:6-pyruvoyl-tetrahydropterin synthase-related protein [Eubacteriales bacterium]